MTDTDRHLNGTERPLTGLLLPPDTPSWGTPPDVEVPVEQAGGVLHAGDRTEPDPGRPVEPSPLRAPGPV